MKILLPVLTLAIIAPGLAHSAEKTCASLKHVVPTSTVNFSLPDPTFEKRTRDEMLVAKAQCERWLKKNNLIETASIEKISAWGQFIIGQNIKISNVQTVSRDFDKEASPRTSCIYLKNIDVLLTTDNLIRIRDEFPQGSCKYKHIADHEMRHYKAGEKVILDVNRKLRAALPDLIVEAEKQSKPVPIKQEKEEAQRVVNILHKMIWDFIITNSTELKKLNDEIDSLASYQAGWKLMAECDKH